MELKNLLLLNVLSHSHSEIPFDQIRAACMQGPNGSGKSCVPDAILLALFGECPRGKGYDLIKLGETEMTIILDLAQSGQIYRILRKWSNVGKGKAIVELSQNNGEVAPFDWETISTGEEAKEKILEIIGRDYKTFTSSSFLLQGQGEKFINTKATSRYEVVFDILGLDKYEEFRSKAVKKKNILSGLKEVLLKTMDVLREKAGKLDGLLLRKADADKRLEETRKDLSENESTLSIKASEAAVLESRIKEAEVIRKDLADKDFEKVRIETEISALVEPLPPLSPELVAEVDNSVNTLSLEDAVSQEATVKTQIEALKSVDAEMASCQMKQTTIKERIAEQESHKAIQKKILDNKEKIQQFVLEVESKNIEVTTLKDDITTLQKEVAELDEKVRQSSTLATSVASLQGLISVKKNQREAECKAVQTKIDTARKAADVLVQSLRTRIAEQEGLKVIQQRILDDRDKILQAVREVETKNVEISTLKADISALQKEIDELDAKTRQSSALATSIAGLQGAISVKKSQREADCKAVRTKLDAARKAAELLTQTFCKGEGEYGTCTLIKSAADAKASVPVLEAELQVLTEPLVLDEDNELKALLLEKKGLDDQTPEKTAAEKKLLTTAKQGAITTIESYIGTLKTLTEQVPLIATAEVEMKRLDVQISDLNKEIIKSTEEATVAISVFETELQVLSEPIVMDEDKELEALLLEKKGLDDQAPEKTATEKKLLITAKQGSIATIEARLNTLKTWTEKAPLIPTAEVEMKRADAAIVELNKDLADIDTRLKTFNKQKEDGILLPKKLAVLNAVVARLRISSETKALRSQLEGIVKSIAEITSKLQILDEDGKNLAVLQVEVTDLRSIITSLKESEKTLLTETLSIGAEIKGCHDAEAELKTKEAEEVILSSQIQTFEVLEGAYEKIPFIILDNVIELMETEANKVLEEISTTGMRLELKTQKMNKSGKGAKDALEIIVSDIAGERIIELYSGGEKTRQILGIAVGLAELSARKAGIKIGTLLIDEPAGLDAQGMRDFGKCFIQLVESGLFSSGILIAHDEILKDVFEQKIIFSKEGSDSHIEVTV